MKPIIPNEQIQLPTAFLTDIRSIIDTGRRQAYAAVGQSTIATFWNVGRRIVEEEQNGQGRAAYGTGLIKSLAERLTPVYGTSYSKRNLDYYKKFYLLFPERGNCERARSQSIHMLPNTNPICPPKRNCVERLISRNNSSWNNTIRNKPMATCIKHMVISKL